MWKSESRNARSREFSDQIFKLSMKKVSWTGRAWRQAAARAGANIIIQGLGFHLDFNGMRLKSRSRRFCFSSLAWQRNLFESF